MSAITATHTAEPSHTTRETPCETCHTQTAEQLRKQEADRAFEAAVQRFLEVSRAA
jgi:hypothetical protein